MRRRIVTPISVSVLPKESLIFPTVPQLKYYYEQSPGITITETRDWLPKPAIHSINSDGLNERYDYPVEKPQGTYRIITIGDSFTEGMFVDTKDNYSERLEDTLNSTVRCPGITHFDVINLGVEGYDMQYVLERYKRKGIKYAPDLVVFLTQENDWTEQNEEMMGIIASYRERIAATDAAALLQKETNDPDPARALGYRDYIASPAYSRARTIGKQGAYFQELRTLVSVPLVLFTFQDMPDDIREVVWQVQPSLPPLYVASVIPRIYDAVADGHPSSRGHEQIANLLYDYIMKYRLIPCP